MKDISLTPFSKVNLTKGLSIGSELDVQQILSSILPGEEFSNVILLSFTSICLVQPLLCFLYLKICLYL